MVVRTIQLLSRITDNPRETRKNHKKRVHVVVKGGEWKKAGRRFWSFERLRRGQLPNNTCMLKHKEHRRKRKEGTRIVHPRGYHIGGKKEKLGGKDEKEIQIVPPIPWVPQKGIFRLTQKENTNYIQKRGYVEVFSIFFGGWERKKKKKLTHRERIPDNPHFHIIAKNGV